MSVWVLLYMCIVPRVLCCFFFVMIHLACLLVIAPVRVGSKAVGTSVLDNPRLLNLFFKYISSVLPFIHRLSFANPVLWFEISEHPCLLKFLAGLV